MTTAVSPAKNVAELAGAWREARRIYPVYAALIQQFELGVGPNAQLESPINRAEPEILSRIGRWFDEVDTKCEVWHLRQVLQTAAWISDEQLRSLIRRHLAKAKRDGKIRDKVDYLVVQYYAHHAPQDAHNSDLSFAHVAELLHEVTGEVAAPPPFAADLEQLIKDLNACTSLKGLLQNKVIDRARALKDKAGEAYFKPESLVAFARWNFFLRLGFFRLMHADLHAIRFALHEMEQRGQSVCDCSTAGLSKTESLLHLREICHDWKKPFRAAYSAAVNFKQIVSVRDAVEAALKAPVPNVSAPPTPRSVAPDATTPPRHENAATAPASPNLLSVDQCLEQIAERLLHTTIKNASVTNLMFGDTKVLLASWEVEAFMKGGNDLADTLQRAVAARVVLNLAMDAMRTGQLGSVREMIGTAHAEVAQLQERIAEAKEKKNIDAAVNLAATSKRLSAQIAEAEKLG